MQQVIDFFRHLFDSSSWPARWYCGSWAEFHGWLYVGSDLMIWLAYFVIPVIIIYFIQRRPDIRFVPIFWLFGAFILLCGATHLLDAIIFWWPAYRLSAFLRFLTAVVSFTTVVCLVVQLPRALALIPLMKNEQEQEVDLVRLLQQKEAELEEVKQRMLAEQQK